MPKAAKLGDIGTDHDGFPPTPIIAGSSSVMIDGKPAARQCVSATCQAKASTSSSCN